MGSSRMKKKNHSHGQKTVTTARIASPRAVVCFALASFEKFSTFFFSSYTMGRGVRHALPVVF